MSIPISFVLATLSLLLAARLSVLRTGSKANRAIWIGFFGLVTIEATLVGMRFGYGFTALVPLQAVLPLFFAPLLYLGFATLTDPPARIGPHLAVALGLALLPQIVRPVAVLIDALVAVSYAVYLVALIRLWRSGPAVLSTVPAETADRWFRYLRGAILLLAGVLVLDVSIALDFGLTQGANVTLLILCGSLAIIAAFVAVLLAPLDMLSANGDPGPAPEEADVDLAERLRALLDKTALHHDPDISLTRLARRLGVPSRALSRAINSVHGESVPQWINNRRVADAAEMLRDSADSVSAIHQACGFLSRSNFYREFQRVHGQSPGAYRSASRGGNDPNQVQDPAG